MLHKDLCKRKIIMWKSQGPSRFLTPLEWLSDTNKALVLGYKQRCSPLKYMTSPYILDAFLVTTKFPLSMLQLYPARRTVMSFWQAFVSCWTLKRGTNVLCAYIYLYKPGHRAETSANFYKSSLEELSHIFENNQLLKNKPIEPVFMSSQWPPG